MKKIIAIVLVVQIFTFSVWLGINGADDLAADYKTAPRVPFAISASHAVLLDGDTLTPLLGKMENMRAPMASTTKIMTALVAIENTKTGNFDVKFRIDDAAVGVEGSSIYLRQGENISMRDLLYALMLESANDAAEAIAIHIGGSVEGFAAMMNERARKLGLSDTNFTNPHGLDDPNHYTTALELALITAEAFQNEMFEQIVSTKTYTMATDENTYRYFTNNNRLLKSYPDCIGVKTGYTRKDGRTLVSAARRDGVLLIAVTLNAPNDWSDHTSLLDYGFALMSGE